MDDNLLRRFWNKVDKKGPAECWLWTAYVSADGYGAVKIQGKVSSAHRTSYLIKHGREIPDGMYVCHTCDVRNCVNPSHLFLGTCRDNMRDAATKGRMKCVHRPGETHPAAKLTETDVLDIISSPLSQLEIARKFGIARTTVSSIKTAKNWGHIGGARGGGLMRGETHPKAKLTEDQVIEIRSSTDGQREIAARYGVAASLISMIRSHKIWRHLTDTSALPPCDQSR